MKRIQYSLIKPDGMRVLLIYLMLDNRQIVNYKRIGQALEISYKTFGRTIASLRDAVGSELLCAKAEIVFNRKRNTYELIKY